MGRSRTLKVYWCPRCERQSERPWHLCKFAAPLFPQTAEETQCEEIEVVRASTHQGAVEALGDFIAEVAAPTGRLRLEKHDEGDVLYEAVGRARASLAALRGQ